MRLFRYWVKQAGQLEIQGQLHPAKVYGKSNTSEADAQQDALQILERLQQRVQGKQDALADYEPAIREEIVQEIDTYNVLTRNRYGALILNSEDTVILDIDTVTPSLWQRLVTWRGKAKKARMQAAIEAGIQAAAYRHLSYRLYETAQGMRLLVSGEKIPAASEVADRLMKHFQVDSHYRYLCRIQECYRARLSPKPYRIGLASLRQDWPLDQEQLHRRKKWVEEYEEKSQSYAVCRFIQEYGGSEKTLIVQLHDAQCKVHTQLPLA